MAYEKSTYTGLNDALDKLRIFIAARSGWVVDSFADDSTVYAGNVWTGKRLHVHQGSNYFNFRTARNQQIFQGTSIQTLGIGMNGSRGYSGAATWDYQTGAILNASSQSTGGHCNAMLEGGGIYYFFSDANDKAITAIFESAYPNVYTKMTFGTLSNGWQFYASNDRNTTLAYLFTHVTSSLQTTCNFSKATWNPSTAIWTLGQDSSSGSAPASTNAMISPLCTVATTDGQIRSAKNTVQYSPNTITGNPVFSPCHFWWYNNSSNYQYLGYVPDMFLTSMRYYDNGQEITMPNLDVYVVFNNNYTDTSLGGKGAGIAIKKVT